MIRIRLREQLEKKRLAERRRITLNEVAKKAGISRTTLNRVANIPGYNTNTNTIEALCNYFECEIDDLVERIEVE
ncbi:MAG TPA: helix-turn-helix transcriptional regulator [Gammaproteobacteria bacterium]